MLRVVLLNLVMLTVIMLTVVMLSVMAPFFLPRYLILDHCWGQHGAMASALSFLNI
jgi:hypothetical protein